MKLIRSIAVVFGALVYLNFAAGAAAQTIVVGGKNFTEQ